MKGDCHFRGKRFKERFIWGEENENMDQGQVKEEEDGEENVCWAEERREG